MATRIKTERQFVSLQQALVGTAAPEEICESLVLINTPYIGFDGNEHIGQLVMRRHLRLEVIDIFHALLKMRFPIARMVPLAAYEWNDEASMEDNNSSAFNYRVKTGKDELSVHSYGTAVDLNPRQNPFLGGDRGSYPAGAVYDISMPGTVTPKIAMLFKERGWTWGGDWISIKDYQHFEKP